jgi:hypothetical protein
MGAAAWLSTSRWAARKERLSTAAIGGLLVAGYCSLTTCLWDWLVDDAAITFAYSRNLIRGFGLTIHPSHAPEEGYSNTSWMLILAGAHAIGMDIATTAKRLGVALGAVAVGLSYFVSVRLTGKRFSFPLVALAGTVALGGPFLVWSGSGLETSIQAAMLMTVVAAPFWPRFERPLMAGALSVLVLSRPETPMVVALVGATLILRDPTRREARAAILRCWPVVVVPALVWLALMAFRLAYFHSPLATPYYAKAGRASWFRLVNFVGQGWLYTFDWLSDLRVWLIVPFLFLAPLRRAPLPYQLALAVCISQLAFVVFVGGDWMGCYRFVAPALPALAVCVVFAAAEAGRRWWRISSAVTCLAFVWIMGLGTITQLVLFRSDPTTPISVVAAVGRTFLELGHRLGVAAPSIAHHDAGGTSYDADMEVLDLAGLGDREVAMHATDAAFIRRYLFEIRRPTFVFGTNRSFLAGTTKFHLMPEFTAQYVPVQFPGRAYMQADLCHVRRDVIHEAPGIERVGEGASEYWVVTMPAAPAP